jgi:hypothetical protein
MTRVSTRASSGTARFGVAIQAGSILRATDLAARLSSDESISPCLLESPAKVWNSTAALASLVPAAYPPQAA